MDILNWLRIKKQQLIRTTLDSPKDLVVLGADVSFQKRGDKYQSYAMPAEDFLATAARPYKVYTALLTQSGESNWVNQTSGTFTVGVTYKFDTYSGVDDFSNIGGPPAAPYGTWDGYSFVATGTTPLVYTNSSSIDHNTGAPVVTVLENTIGNVWFTYNDVGYYKILSTDDLFTNNKTFVLLGPYVDPEARIIYASSQIDSNNIIIGNTSDGGPTNGALQNTPIEIRVYN